MGTTPVGKMMMLLVTGTIVLCASLILAFSSSTGAEEADRANPSTVMQRQVAIFIVVQSIESIDEGTAFCEV